MNINGWFDNILQIAPTTSMWGLYITSIAFVLLSLWLWWIYTNKKKWYLLIDLIFGSMYDFFAEILGDNIPPRVVKNVMTIFYFILVLNVLSVIIDIFKVWFPWLQAYHFTPTTDFNFTIALAIFTVIYLVVEEVRAKWGIKTILSYIPIIGGGYLIPQEKMPRTFVEIITKIFDIIISLFIGMLDIIGQLAKIISLWGRLFGNMWSWWLLLTIAIGWWMALTSYLPGEIPFLVPIIVHIQGLFVAGVQALVFSLLLAIFVKLAYE